MLVESVGTKIRSTSSYDVMTDNRSSTIPLHAPSNEVFQAATYSEKVENRALEEMNQDEMSKTFEKLNGTILQIKH